jgi:hypothetical protein
MKLYPRIRFKPKDAILRTKYSPADILGYRCGDRTFESFPIEEDAAFFRFRYYLDDNSNYLDFIPLFYRPGSNAMVRVTQGVLGLKRKRLVEYFQD